MSDTPPPRPVQSGAPARRGPPSPRVGQAVELVLQSGKRVSLGQLSALVGVSRFHLLREFARQLGAPPVRFQTLRRLERAAQLLRAGHRPIDVAHHLGYADQAHFSRLFKQHRGMPPGAYARAARASAPVCGESERG